MPTLPPSLLHTITKRGVAEIISATEFVRMLEAGRPLRLKMGFDPSRPDLHLGHVVGLRKLRQLQDLGHQLILIVGDWTAQIGDPSGASDTRTMLTAAQVRENAESYMRQFFKVVDRSRTQAVYQSEWFGTFTLADVIHLTSHFTVNQFLHRDDFAKRYAAGRPVAVTELLYPLLQAYDSVAIKADVEFGGTDQKFNLLVGRELQDRMGQRPQQCFIMPLLVGTDGTRKMSKSLNNYIAIEDPPAEMFGKVMSLPDALVPTYYELLTDLPDAELPDLRRAVEAGGAGVMDVKKRLAGTLVGTFHTASAALEARAGFERVFQGGAAPAEVREFRVSGADAAAGILGVNDSGVLIFSMQAFLVAAGLAESHSAARRLIRSGAVMVDGTPFAAGPQMPERPTAHGDTEAALSVPWGAVVRVGPRRFVRIVKA